MHSTPPPHRFLVADGPTPEFVRWSVDRACEIRQPLTDPTPRRCEQFLRPLRAIGEALRDGRVVDDIAVAREATESIGPRGPIGPINSLNPIDSIEPAEWIGFRVSEVAAYYGGLARVGRSSAPPARSAARRRRLRPRTALGGLRRLAAAHSRTRRRDRARVRETTGRTPCLRSVRADEPPLVRTLERLASGGSGPRAACAPPRCRRGRGAARRERRVDRPAPRTVLLPPERLVSVGRACPIRPNARDRLVA